MITEALLRAAALDVRHLKATYPAAYIASFAAAGFQELRRRTGMIASTNISVPQVSLPNSLRIRHFKEGDSDQVGTLLQRAYTGGPDDLHPDLATWRDEVRAIQDGQFGPFLADNCYVTEHTLDRFHLAGAILVHLERNVPTHQTYGSCSSVPSCGPGSIVSSQSYANSSGGRLPNGNSLCYTRYSGCKPVSQAWICGGRPHLHRSGTYADKMKLMIGHLSLLDDDLPHKVTFQQV